MTEFEANNLKPGSMISWDGPTDFKVIKHCTGLDFSHKPKSLIVNCGIFHIKRIGIIDARFIRLELYGIPGFRRYPLVYLKERKDESLKGIPQTDLFSSAITDTKRLDVYKKAIKQYGRDHQLHKAIEELNELAVEISHSIRDIRNIKDVTSEMADVLITMEQVKIILGIQSVDVDSQIDYKTKRLEERLENENIEH